MQVILTTDIPKVGQKGQLIKVKPGYFRNFLLPQNLAQYATSELIKQAEELNAKIKAEKAELAKNAESVKETLESKELHLKEKLTVKGTLYAKVTAIEVSTAINTQFGVKIDASDIKLDKHIKETGEHTADVKITPEVHASLKIIVEGEE